MTVFLSLSWFSPSFPSHLYASFIFCRFCLSRPFDLRPNTLLSLLHFSHRQWSFSSLSPDFLHHFHLISVPLSFSLAIISPNNLIKAKYIVEISLPILVGHLLFSHRSPLVLPFVPTVVGYLRLVGSPISFSPDFSSSCIVPLWIPIDIALGADLCWIFEVSRLSNSWPRFV